MMLNLAPTRSLRGLALWVILWLIDFAAILGFWMAVDGFARGSLGVSPILAYAAALPVCTALASLWVIFRVTPCLTRIAGQETMRQELALTLRSSNEVLSPILYAQYIRALLPFVAVVVHPTVAQHEYRWMTNLVDFDIVLLSSMLLNVASCVAVSLAFFSQLLRGRVSAMGFLTAQVLSWVGIQLLILVIDVIVLGLIMEGTGWGGWTQSHIPSFALAVFICLVGGFLWAIAWKSACGSLYRFE